MRFPLHGSTNWRSLGYLTTISRFENPDVLATSLPDEYPSQQLRSCFTMKLVSSNSVPPVRLSLFRRLLGVAMVWLVCVFITSTVSNAQQPPREGKGYTDTPQLPDQPWRVHDKHRPRPPKITPGAELGQPPSDAVVLFDGTDLAHWKLSGSDKPSPWKVEDGYMEVTSGTAETVDQFGDMQLHIEWATPTEVKGDGQGRGNSGVIIMGRYEIQVLDSFDNDTYADGQAASIYGQFPPQVDVNRGPGQWQTYDIIFEAPRFEGDKLTKPARATVFHNGVLVHHAREFIGPMAHQQVAPYVPHPPTGPIVLQDHGNPTRFRNIWARPLRNEVMPWIELEGGEGPGKGKKVVLMAGDQEYRSEEALPMLAQILSKHHGFDCVVLFSINPDTGTVDPNYVSNTPGLHHLDDADMLVMSLRFRQLPDWQMKHIVDFYDRGGAIMGLRTSTHAFQYPGDSPSKYKHWSFDNGDWKGGFGQQVLGDTWVSHHGNHKVEATRGIIREAAKDLPIMRGVEDVFGPTDVYGVAHLPEDANVLMDGQVLTGMQPTDPPVDGPKNNPMMPIAWTRIHKTESGKECKILTTTMGSSTDLENEGLRRLLVNGVYWGTGLEDQIPEKANVEITGKYIATPYGFQNEPGYFSKQLLAPIDFLPKE
jgi:Domain of Unknown Function (DUF1080)